MQEPRRSITLEQLYSALDSCAGNKTAMAQQLGCHRDTVRQLLTDYGIGDKPVVGGYIKPQAANVLPLPAKGQVFRYILTSAQNNTKAFRGFVNNLIAYRGYLKAGKDTATIMVSRFTYNKLAYENNFNHQSKPGRGPTDADHQDLWYDKILDPYICDDPDKHGSSRYQLAPDLQWCAEMNILPTHDNPFSKLDDYAGNGSGIFPHAKVAMRSVPRMPDDPIPRLLYTTGTCTQMNYIQRKAGQTAEFHHVYGALIVEVNSDGDWWARQINADSNGTFYDIPRGKTVKVKNGKITEGHRIEALNWGDVHASEIDKEVQRINWGGSEEKGVIDILRPRQQFLNDLFSMRSQGHHDRDKFGRRYEKFIRGQDNVQTEVDDTAAFLKLAQRDFCKTVVVNSNHDRHGDRWLDEANYKADLPNADFFLDAQSARVKSIKAGRTDWWFLKWAIHEAGRHVLPKIRFLGIAESYLIGPPHHQVQCGLHGDLGPNGARGSTRNLAGMGRRGNKGHDHQATIFKGTYSAGACQMDMDYNKGPTSWSISHILTYLNGKRCIVTQRAGRLWA